MKPLSSSPKVRRGTYRKRLLGTTPLLTMAVLALAACRETVTVTTAIDFSSQPYHGTFSVDEGADALGCASGTFVDTVLPEGINKEMTCEEGAGQGSFTIFFDPIGEEPGQPWRVVSATGDFRGLEGDGEFSIEYSDDQTGVETLIGKISYELPAQMRA